MRVSCGVKARVFRVASNASRDPALEEPTLHRATSQPQRTTEVLAGQLVPSTAKLKFAERG